MIYWELGVCDGLTRRNCEDDLMVEGVLVIREIRWGAQTSCWTGVIY